MSSRIGALQQRPRLSSPALVAGILAVVLAATVWFVAYSVVRERGGGRSHVATSQTVEANTPSELNAASQTVEANTPSELNAASVATSAGDAESIRPFGRRGVTPKTMPGASHAGIVINGEICGQCR